MSSENPFAAPLVPATPVGLQPTLFSFSERIPRRVYWAVRIGMVVVYTGIVLLASLIFGRDSAIYSAVTVVAYLVLLWVGLATAVKRWHDRDKSGWWVLINLIPLVGAIWSFVELGCLRGTPGPNQFGVDCT